jgi:hypothetical protein
MCEREFAAFVRLEEGESYVTTGFEQRWRPKLEELRAGSWQSTYRRIASREFLKNRTFYSVHSREDVEALLIMRNVGTYVVRPSSLTKTDFVRPFCRAALKFDRLV